MRRLSPPSRATTKNKIDIDLPRFDPPACWSPALVRGAGLVASHALRGAEAEPDCEEHRGSGANYMGIVLEDSKGGKRIQHLKLEKIMIFNSEYNVKIRWCACQCTSGPFAPRV